jgi:putative copper export protein
VCTARWLILPRVRDEMPESAAADVERRWTRLSLGASVILVVSLLARVWAHTVSVFSLADSLSVDNLRLVAIESRWGVGWRVQMAGALALLVVSRWNLTRRRVSWIATSVAAAGVCFALPLVGHAAGSGARVLLHGIHVLGAGVWLGTLAVLFFTSYAEDRGPGTPASGSAAAPDVRAVLLRHFSGVAYVGAPVALSAGLAAAVLYLGPVSSLWTTPYGRVLALKVGFVFGVAVCGYFNWRFLRRVPTTPGAAGEPPAVAAEMALAGAVVFLTAFLTELAHP